VEELATSAAEPRLVVVRKDAKGKPEQLHEHPVLDLFEHPNGFTSRYALIASMIMYRAISGNTYIEKTRSASGKVVELWSLRPDRVFVVPDKQKHIGSWEYRLEGDTYQVPADDIIQNKTRNPLDDWYGLPPLAVCAERVDTDAMLRSFTLAFFRNAAVPAGLLNITKQVTGAERQLIRDKFRAESGGPQNWHQMMVLDNMEAKYTPMGLPLGQSGIVLPELDEISEARIAMAFGVPLELVGARLGMIHGNRTTTEAARKTFWDETLVPLYQELAADLTRGLVNEPWEGEPFDYIEFDLSTVKALAEDDDKKHTRCRADLAAGGISVQEFRQETGREPDFDKDAILIFNDQIVAQRADQMLNPPAPEAVPPTPQVPAGQNGNGHKPMSPDDMARLRELAAGR
jgi:HK97 family phage portal protein